MNRPSLIHLATTVALSTVLLGCTTESNGAKHALTVEEAKAALIAEENRIASVIPAKYVEKQEQLESAYLISCRHDEYTWPDQGTIVLQGSPDISSLLALIAVSYEKRQKFSVRHEKTWNGAERLIISGEDGANYYLSPTPEGFDIQLDSFSACFKLGPDQWSGDRY